MAITQQQRGYRKTMHNQLEHSPGFTLMELMVTIAIAGILLGVAIPSFTSIISNNRLTTYTNELVTALNLARSEAIKRGQPITIKRISDTPGDWGSGWTVFTDLHGDGTLDIADGDTLLRTYAALPTSFTLRGTYVNRITYQASGISANGSFVICDNSDNNDIPEANTSKLITVNSIGRPHIGIDSDKDGIPEKDDGTEINSCINSPFTPH
jgi:type IV fimbrial biogenesis protein FimT